MLVLLALLFWLMLQLLGLELAFSASQPHLRIFVVMASVLEFVALAAVLAWIPPLELRLSYL